MNAGLNTILGIIALSQLNKLSKGSRALLGEGEVEMEFYNIAHILDYVKPEIADNITSIRLLNHRDWYPRFSEIPGELMAFPNLKHLYIGKSVETTGIPDWIGRLTNLESLVLDQTSIDRSEDSKRDASRIGISPEIGKCTKLKVFRIQNIRSDCTLHLSDSMLNLSNLRVFDVGYTYRVSNLMTILDNIEKFPELEVINIGADAYSRRILMYTDDLQNYRPDFNELRERIAVFLKKLPKLKHLKELNISGLVLYNDDFNEIILENVSKIKTLQSLNMFGIGFKSLSADIGNLTNLESLIISGNDFEGVPTELYKLRNLKKFSIQNMDRYEDQAIIRIGRNQILEMMKNGASPVVIEELMKYVHNDQASKIRRY